MRKKKRERESGGPDERLSGALNPVEKQNDSKTARDRERTTGERWEDDAKNSGEKKKKRKREKDQNIERVKMKKKEKERKRARDGQAERFQLSAELPPVEKQSESRKEGRRREEKWKKERTVPVQSQSSWERLSMTIRDDGIKILKEDPERTSLKELNSLFRIKAPTAQRIRPCL